MILSPSDDFAGTFAAALSEAAPEGSILHLEPGRYLFHRRDAFVLPIPISNANADDGSVSLRHAAICMRGKRNLILDGHGAELWFDGDVSPLILQDCENISLRNFSINFFRPRVSEFRLLSTEGNHAEFSISPGSPFTITTDGRLAWLNAEGKAEYPESVIPQCASADGKRNLRSDFHPLRAALSAEQIGRDRVRLRFPEPFPGNRGDIWQFRAPARNENGILIDHCRNIRLEELHLHFTPGLGVIAQMSRDLRFHRLVHAPAEKSGRFCAAFADCIHISACRGNVELSECRFFGTQDDPVNIHGIYLKIDNAAGNELTLRFMQPETWGILPFEPGDRVALVDGKTLSRLEYRTITAAVPAGLRRIRLFLAEPFSHLPESAVIENMSAYPDAVIRECSFAGYPTRAILLSSAGKCAILRNTFEHASPFPAIYISGDARCWYESGGVTNLEISANLFRNCDPPAISILPETEPDSRETVHDNIRISGNRFENCTSPYLVWRNVGRLTCDIPGQMVRQARNSE